MSEPRSGIDKLLRPRSVAIVGASPREHSAGWRVVDHLRRFGFPGDIFPVNPRHQEVLGLRCYAGLAQLPETPELVFAAVPAERVAEVLDQAGRMGAGAAIVNASGFADAGAAGKLLQDDIVRIAETYGMALCGPNNNGLMNFLDKTMLCVPIPKPDTRTGGVAVISQSGSVSFSLSRDKAGLGLAYVISAGNEAQLTTADYLAAMVRDARVHVVLLFLEAIRAPQRFAEAARAAAQQGKSIIAMKVGRSAVGQAAVEAHTGTFAGEDRLYDAFFRHCGVVRVDDLDEMIETAAIFAAKSPTPASKPVAPRAKTAVAITGSGGQAATVADIAERFGLRLPQLSDETTRRLQAIYPPIWHAGNPLDAWALGWDAKRYRETLDILASDPDIGIVLPVVEPRPYGNNRAIAEMCGEVAAQTGRAFAFINDSSGGDREPAVKDALDRGGTPYLSGVRNGILGLARWLHHRPPDPGAATISPDVAVRCRDLALRSSVLADPDRFALLAALGMPMVACRTVETAAAARQIADEIGYPVVLKGSAPDLAHKSEHGLVALGLATAEDLTVAFASLRDRLSRASRSPLAAITLQPHLGGGIELVVGVRNYPGFGPLVVVGLGGTLVELINETSARLGPVTPEAAAEMLHEIRAGTLLAGFRGSPPFDVAAAANAIAALSRFGAATQDLVAAIEINPLIVHRAGNGAHGVDAVLELSGSHGADAAGQE